MENTDSHLTAFDEMTFSNRLQILKTFFPYLPVSSQRFLSSYIKISELSAAFKMCQDNTKNNLSACSTDNQKTPVELLNDIKSFCSPTEKNSIDNAINFMNTFQMYREFMEFEKDKPSGEHNSFFDTIKNMLSPEQQAMFNNYETSFNSSET